MRLRMSTFNISAISNSISRDSCILLEHHRDTVPSFLPTYLASHLPVFPFSTNTTFILFIFWVSIMGLLLNDYNKLIWYAKLQILFEITKDYVVKQ